MMTDPLDREGDRAAREIERLSRDAMRRFWWLVENGTAPQTAITQVQGEFVAAAVTLMLRALAAVVGPRPGPDVLRELPVAGVVLSRRLYAHAGEVSMRVGALVREHAAGVTQARSLAMAIYDGYVPTAPDVRPLEGRARAKLPRELRTILASDRQAADSLAALIERAKAQAERLKTAPLRAGYMEALTAWENGAAEKVLRRTLDVAVREKTRYFANRIAQTEIARAYQKQRAAELMGNARSTVVEVRMDPSHPLTDICDLHAKADLHGLGPGIYPKKEAPLPPYHPFCRCRLRDRPDLTPAGAKERSPVTFLSSMRESDAARVMGSRDRLQRVLDGEPVEDVLNAGKDPAFHLTRVGEIRPVPATARRTVSPLS